RRRRLGRHLDPAGGPRGHGGVLRDSARAPRWSGLVGHAPARGGRASCLEDHLDGPAAPLHARALPGPPRAAPLAPGGGLAPPLRLPAASARLVLPPWRLPHRSRRPRDLRRASLLEALLLGPLLYLAFVAQRHMIFFSFAAPVFLAPRLASLLDGRRFELAPQIRVPTAVALFVVALVMIATAPTAPDQRV